MPRFSEDDVVDFFLTEAIVYCGKRSEREAHKKAEVQAKIDEFQNDPIPPGEYPPLGG